LLHIYSGDDPMLNYDPNDSTITLVESLEIYDATGENLNIEALHKDVSDDIDTVTNQARQACTCDEEAKQSKGKTQDGDVEVCLPCEARGALNAIRAVAEKG
jgi:hypothetical protein